MDYLTARVAEVAFPAAFQQVASEVRFVASAAAKAYALWVASAVAALAEAKVSAQACFAECQKGSARQVAEQA